jgi:nicotinamidase-related amidase
MLNFFACEGDATYKARFSDTVTSIAALRLLASNAHLPWIYVNTQFESIDVFRQTAMARKAAPHWLKGTPEAEVVATLAPTVGDHVIPKTVNSGFYDTDLDATLRECGIERLVIVGVHTHVCVALTAADAFYRNYDVIVVEECVTTIVPERHRCGLDYIARHFGRVVRLAEVPALFDLVT